MLCCDRLFIGLFTNIALRVGTGVAYASLQERHKHSSSDPRPPVRVLQHGGVDRTKEGKIPTQVVYDTGNIAGGPVAWGFGCKTESKSADNRVYGFFFKQKICPSQWSTKQPRADQPNEKYLPPVNILYEHFLSKLYDHIGSEIRNTVLPPSDNNWESASIEFLFSVPATWNPEAVKNFKGLASKAGFGREQQHSVSTSLTEPEAVAAFTVNEEKKEREFQVSYMSSFPSWIEFDRT